MDSRFDKFVQMLERSAHALRMGLLVSGVVVGSAAIFYVFNRPDDAPAEAMLARLSEAPAPVASFGPRSWTHVCLGEPGQDVNAMILAETGHHGQGCEGDRPYTSLYATYSEIGIVAEYECRIIQVHEELFTPARPGEGRCEARRGLMFFELEDSGPRPHLNVVRR